MSPYGREWMTEHIHEQERGDRFSCTRNPDTVSACSSLQGCTAVPTALRVRDRVPENRPDKESQSPYCREAQHTPCHPGEEGQTPTPLHATRAPRRRRGEQCIAPQGVLSRNPSPQSDRKRNNRKSQVRRHSVLFKSSKVLTNRNDRDGGRPETGAVTTE